MITFYFVVILIVQFSQYNKLLSPVWIIIDLRLVLSIDERKSIDWPPLPPLFFSFFVFSVYIEATLKNVNRFFFLLRLLFLLLSSFFFYIRPLQLNDAFCFNNGLLVKESTSCFNDLARSIRLFVVTTSHREYIYVHILVENYERKIDHHHCYHHSIIIIHS